MECNNDFRHVCQKDLQNYIKRYSYFSDFNSEEVALIQKNLGIMTKKDIDGNFIMIGNYETVYKELQNNTLRIGYIYVIGDFRSIYSDINGKTCGLDGNVPSNEYALFLSANSTCTFDKRVLVGGTQWTAEYDITPVTLPDGTTTKGTITYLKDDNNNTAYYDFKNIKFLKTMAELNKGPITYDNYTYLYTFDNGGADASETICKNNHLECGATRNVFLGNTQNVTLAADCHDNIFFKNCENCIFDYGTYGNFFKDNVVRCKGSVHEKELDSITSSNCPKQFDVLDDNEVMAYLDSQTQTYQFKKL